jgi:hypothetical protein
MQRVLSALCILLYSVAAGAAQPAMNTAALTAFDRLTLQAMLDGDVAGLEPHLAPRFQAAIQVPAEPGRHQTLIFTREEFLLYAWQARMMADDYRVRAKPGNYRIAPDGNSAVGTRIIDESLTWNGQPLRYTSRRTTHYRPVAGRIQITRVEVQILDWGQP